MRQVAEQEDEYCGYSMENRMVSISVFDATSEDHKAITSFFAMETPLEGETLWIDDKRDMTNPKLTEYCVLKRSWVLMMLPGASSEIRSLHCELLVVKAK